MFNDEELFAFKKMHEFSTVDGFVEVGECLAEMIKYVANEPSVGLFYIQQHTQNSVPNLISLSNNVVEKSREMTLHTEDSEDSISTIRSMRECGLHIADEMIKDIRTSLAIMSAKQPKRGLISSTSSAFRIGRTSSWGPVAWGRNSGPLEQDGEKATSYFSNVMKSAKQKASNLKWPQVDTKELTQATGEASVSYSDSTLSVAAGSTSSGVTEPEADRIPLSSQLDDESKEVQADDSMSHDELFSLAENYDEFKADREAKLEEWLGEKGNQDSK